MGFVEDPCSLEDGCLLAMRSQNEDKDLSPRLLIRTLMPSWGFPGRSDGKEFACNVGDLGSILVLGRSPGEGMSYRLLYSCLENSMDRGAWRSTVHRVAEDTTGQLTTHTHICRALHKSCRRC